MIVIKYYFQVEVTAQTYERLKDLQTTAKVHSIFDHTFNILLADNTLYTIADETLNNGPNCLRLKNLHISELELNINDEVYFNDHKFIINNKMIVDYQNMTIKDYPVNRYIVDKEVLGLKIDNILCADWYQEKLKMRAHNPFDREVLKKIEGLSESLKSSVLTNSKDEITKVLKSFVGLGIGLTPSGDDFLSGLAYVSSLEHYPHEMLLGSLKALEDYMKDSTNIISYSQFKMALKQEVRYEINESLKGMISDLTYEESDPMIKEILTIGSTSGFDMLQGMIVAIQLTL